MAPLLHVFCLRAARTAEEQLAVAEFLF